MESGYNNVWTFYRERGVGIVVKDARPYSLIYRRGIRQFAPTGNSEEDFIDVDLGGMSAHSDNNGIGLGYSAGITDNRETRMRHSHGRHEYNIVRRVLEADVIINLPKPKTHLKGSSPKCAVKSILVERVDAQATWEDRVWVRPYCSILLPLVRLAAVGYSTQAR